MRDPGTPRRNPLFAPSGGDETSEAPEPPVTAGAEGPEEEPRPEAREAEPPPDAPGPANDEPVAALHDHSLLGGAGVCPLCTIGVFATSMRDASPEAMEHLLGAAHEFLMAAKVVLDAADRAVELQRAQFAAAAAGRAAAREARPRPGSTGSPSERAAAHRTPGEPSPGEQPPGEQPPPEDPRRGPAGGSGRVRRIHLA